MWLCSKYDLADFVVPLLLKLKYYYDVYYLYYVIDITLYMLSMPILFISCTYICMVESEKNIDIGF